MITKQTTQKDETMTANDKMNNIEWLKSEKEAIENLILTAVQNPTEDLQQVLFDLTNRHIEIEGALKIAKREQNNQ